MSLRTAIFQMKDALKVKDLESVNVELIDEIEKINGLKEGILASYLAHLKKLNLNISDEELPQNESKKINRKWTKNEIEFMFQYLNDRQDEGAINITEILEEIAQLLNRGYQSVNYKYYTLLKKQGKKDPDDRQQNYQFTTIPEMKIPVIYTELIPQIQPEQKVCQVTTTKEDDLLDVLSGFITNIQQLPGLNLNDLLRSLYQLSDMALQNLDDVTTFENIKNEIIQEKAELQEKLKQKERQLAQEKKRNEELQKAILNIANEVSAFNQLSDVAKIQNLKSFNQRLNSVLEKPAYLDQISRTV
ncbi:hypothetical protein [Bacillus sp. T3]|uniref:hypothetical protein n=1 Tax=Bacillus sp. T3 TaxID=467262 RepID=UPI002981DE65|nr:hypothetical protein [Bacillus sp. T3]